MGDQSSMSMKRVGLASLALIPSLCRVAERCELMADCREEIREAPQSSVSVETPEREEGASANFL